MTLTLLSFKIADPKKARTQQSTVAVDRMLIRDDWPLAFRRPEIQTQCDAYKKAIESIVEKCRKGTQLQAADYDHLRDTVTVLQKTVDTAIPVRDEQRTQAREFVRRLDAATKIFAEQDYAEQLIRDVSMHKATDVATLLSFMREYRLMFADPGSSPEVVALYSGLYALLRRQKEELGLRDSPAPSEIFQAGSLWVSADTPPKPLRLRVLERSGAQFKANMIQGDRDDDVREIRGVVGDNSVSWLGSNVRIVKGTARGQDNEGKFNGNQIHFTWGLNGKVQGEYRLRKAP